MPRLSKIGAAALAAFGWTSGVSAVTADFLVVAGGGGGGTGGLNAYNGGAGGAGGYKTGTISLNLTLSYTVTVGAGGATNTVGANSVFSSITSDGGGQGATGSAGATGGNGGSGGGGASHTGGGSNNGTGTSGQGNNGGSGSSASAGGVYGSGGGGGASAVGSNGTSSSGGNGGSGAASSISGSSVTYAGGGGGAASSGSAGTGGAGGGGNGGVAAVGSAGTANLGGGGGAGSGLGANYSGGNGGSGIVIISYVGAQQFGGGVVTSSGGNTIHTFTTSGTLSPLSSLTASYLIVAGGGGAAFGGAGAGGLLSGSSLTIDTNSIYAITVGAGGAGQASTGPTGTNGSNSAFSMVSTTAVGGGGGGAANAPLNGASGGSGGGGGNNGTGGAGTSGQGFAGGTGYTDSASYGLGGGGGGASAVGQSLNSGSNAGGNGGAGSASSISGTSVTYAGGGGGGGHTNGSRAGGTGGAGGGGNGTMTGSASSGTNGLGGGGGGAGTAAGNGGNGGSGIVIISYAGSTQLMAGGTVTVAGGNVIHTFTSSGYLTPIVLANNSLRFRSSASASLSRTPTTASNRTTWTWSGWVKRAEITTTERTFFSAGTDGNNFTALAWINDSLYFQNYTSGTQTITNTTAVFRDPSAWYHIVLAIDTTQATAANRAKIYVNGVQQAGFSGSPFSSSQQFWINFTYTHRIGSRQLSSADSFSEQYLAEVNFIDGQALTPNSFGTFNGLGVWQPIRYGGSYGTNGFYLPFTNSGTGAVTANYLVVAGGGGGAGTASDAGGGGGAGGYQTSTLSITPGVSYTVTVGAGGAGGVGDNNGTQGSNSVFSSVTSTGGGGGGYWNAVGGSGGSAGGTGCNQTSSTAGTAGQGNAGGVPATANQSNAAGGGGGAGAAGGNVAAGTGLSGGVGGVGLQSSISGTSTYYAGGGGGGPSNSGGPATGAGGLGGGGGGNLASSDGVAGTANTGGGGGAAARNSGGGTRTGGTGGSGIVIVSYAGTPKFTGGTITQSGGNTIHTFTSSGTLGSNIAADYSPQGNNWTTNNISLTAGTTYDSMTDVPTLTSATTANYAVFNPLNKSTVGSSTPSNGNLNVLLDRSSNNPWIQSTIAFPSSGKWYLEYSQTSINVTSTPYNMIGVMDVTTPISTDVASVTGLRGYYLWNGNKRSGTTASSYGSGTALNDIIGVAVDMDSGKIWFAVNNTWVNSGSPTGGTNAAFTDLTGTTWSFFNSILGETTSNSWVNFGQRPFTYTPPTGFVALNTYNLPTPTIGATASSQAGKYFNAVTYAGAGAGTVITTGFYPDFAWMKNRTAAFSNFVQDSVRGGGVYLLTDTTDADVAVSPSSTFSSTGITIPFNSSYASNSSYNFVAWAWNANSGSTVSNTAGSITSTVSANTTAGFSIVTYTGVGGSGTTTVGHGLGVAPSMVIIKRRNSTADWATYHTGLTSTSYYLFLNSTAGQANYGSTFISPSSSTLTIDAGSSLLNTSTGTYVAYCFAQVAGYSAFGTYTGNGSSDGVFVFTGFRPRFLMIKRTNSASGVGWFMYDTATSTYNYTRQALIANSSAAEQFPLNEGGGGAMDILSNGFKCRGSYEDINASGSTYIYMAFAENPFKYANAR